MIRHRFWLTALVALALALTAVPVRAQQSGAPKTYPAGWNLVALPAGTNFPAVSQLYTLQPGDLDYEQAPTNAGTLNGVGYWANVPAAGSDGYSRSTTLAAGSNAAYQIPAPAGQWVMVGDPSGMLPASVQGADAAYSYDPVHGYQLVTWLQPGQGAFVFSAAGGVITVTPMQPSAQTQPAPPPFSTAPLPPPASTAGPIPLLPQIPLQTNPATAVFPSGLWTWWPQPPLSGFVNPGAWWPSLPYSGPFLCPSDVITAAALYFCGELANAAPGAGMTPPSTAPVVAGLAVTGVTNQGAGGNTGQISGGTGGTGGGIQTLTGTLVQASGSGTQNSQTFVAPAQWTLNYQYDCTQAGLSDFNLEVFSPIGSTPPPGSLITSGQSLSGSGSQPLFGAGTFYLSVLSSLGCSWTVSATAP